MKTIKINKLHACDFCNKDAYYDAPTSMGGWANMCEPCFKANKSANAEAIGTMFEQHDTIEPKNDGKILQGVESSDPDYLEDVVFDVRNREIECPACREVREVEPDAHYKYDCEGCGAKVQVPEGFC